MEKPFDFITFAGMKIKHYITMILATYIFALMVLPCNDACNSAELTEIAIEHAAQTNHQNDNDVCSPFCFCSCCATAMTELHVPGYSYMPYISAKGFSPLSQSYFSQDIASIWQPPKIG